MGISHWEPYAWIALLGVLLLVAYELYAVYTKQLTLSQMVWRASAKHPAIPFGFGVLMGHFFF